MDIGRCVGRIAGAILAVWFLSLGAAASLGGDPSPNLLPNGSFDGGSSGWGPGQTAKGIDFGWQKDTGRGGSGALHLRSAPDVEGGPWIWWGWIEKPPTDAPLKISGWIRGKDVKYKAAICVQAWDAAHEEQVAFATTPQSPPLRGDFDWTHVQTVLPATPKMARLAVLAFVVGDGEVWFDDLRVERTDEKPTPSETTARPGLVLLTGKADIVSAEDGAKPHLLLPVPLVYREQVPLTYELRADPAAALTGARVYEDRPGNWVVDATFGATKKGERVHLSWTSIVLCSERSFADVPETAPIPGKWPVEALPWLRATACVQCGDPRIVAIGEELRNGTNDVREVVRRVLLRSGEIRGSATGDMTGLTALEALDRHGSCTSNANLVAALLRASGVPARVLAGYPLWSGPLQTHYIVEAYVPGYGWYPIESSMLEEAWPPFQQIEVSVVPPEYEDASGLRKGVMGGVPYLSLTERVQNGRDADTWSEFGTIAGSLGCDHVADLLREIPTQDAAADWTAAIGAARKRWGEWLAHAKLDEKGRLATPLQADAISATTAGELARQLSR